jgi:hypothetical protein
MISATTSQLTVYFCHLSWPASSVIQAMSQSEEGVSCPKALLTCRLRVLDFMILSDIILIIMFITPVMMMTMMMNMSINNYQHANRLTFDFMCLWSLTKIIIGSGSLPLFPFVRLPLLSQQLSTEAHPLWPYQESSDLESISPCLAFWIWLFWSHLPRSSCRDWLLDKILCCSRSWQFHLASPEELMCLSGPSLCDHH